MYFKNGYRREEHGSKYIKIKDHGLVHDPINRPTVKTEPNVDEEQTSSGIDNIICYVFIKYL